MKPITRDIADMLSRVDMVLDDTKNQHFNDYPGLRLLANVVEGLRDDDEDFIQSAIVRYYKDLSDQKRDKLLGGTTSDPPPPKFRRGQKIYFDQCPDFVAALYEQGEVPFGVVTGQDGQILMVRVESWGIILFNVFDETTLDDSRRFKRKAWDYKPT